VVIFVARALVHRLAGVRWEEIHVQPYFLGLFILCMFAMTLPAAVTSRLLLASVCRPPRWREMLAISWLSRMGKYVPGKVLSVAGAVYLLRRRGVPGALATSIIFLNSLLLVIVGIMMAAPLVLWEPVRKATSVGWVPGLALIGIGILLLHPRILLATVNAVLRKLNRPPLQRMPRMRDYFKPVVCVLCHFPLAGLATWLLARSLTDVPAAWLGIYISGTALAATMGFLALFAPGGLGVREGILLLILTPSVGAEMAALIAVTLRLFQILIELIMAACALLILRREPNMAGTATGVAAEGRR